MRNLTIEELKQIAGGDPGEGAEHSQSTKNNGWGNGAEGTNPGSFQGLTEPSKSSEADFGTETPNNNPNLDER
ncbi:MAG: hypothetical protein HY527_18565 [Betaproteobacteria bacterium]|nr:hypothetical protein [Betaproteobacteria bacterium]